MGTEIIITIAIIIGLIVAVCGITTFITREKPLNNDELITLIGLQTKYEEVDRLLNKYIGDSVSVKVSWLLTNFNIEEYRNNSNSLENYKYLVNRITNKN